VILGASGAGKSSFLRAGLLPRLARDDRAFLPLPIVRPERAALTGETGLYRSLEAAVKAAGLRQTRAEVKAAVESGAPAVTALLATLAEKVRAPAGTNESQPQRPRVVLAIDQAEELFLAEGANEAETFLRLVRDLAADPSSNLIVIATIRSDAYERLQTAAALEGVRQETLSLPPMPKGAYQTVIEGPAARLADTNRPLKIEPGLTAALLHDVEEGGAKDALPLLAFTLERLYLEHGGDGDLRLSEYRQIGGIKGSIDAAVEGALRAADADPAVPRDHAAREALLRRALIPWLAGIDPETGAPRRRIARLTEIPEEARPLVSHLIAARLLATDRNPDTGETTVEPAHEALLRQWGLLQGWLDEDFAALSTLEAVKRAARDWEANARSADWLAHAAGRLDDAEALLARDDFAASLDPADRAYLAAARAADTARRDRELEEARKLAAAQKDAAEAATLAADRQRQVARRTRIGLIAASVLAVLAAGLALFALDQAHRADAQAKIAEEERMAAEEQRNEAERQRAAAEQARIDAEQEKQRAQQNFAAAKQVVDSLLLDVVGGFRNVAGIRVEDIRHILGTVEATVGQLTQAAPNDPGLARTHALMLGSIAETYRVAGAINDALRSAEESLSIFRERRVVDPRDAQTHYDLSDSLLKLGHIRMLAGDRAGGMSAAEEGLAISRDLAKARPDGGDARKSLSFVLLRVGSVRLRAGDYTGALAAMEESLAIRRDLVAINPGSQEAQRDLAVALSNLVGAKVHAGKSSGSLAAIEESVAISRRLAAADPGDTLAQGDLAQGLSRLAQVSLNEGDLSGAFAAHEEALAIARQIAAADKDHIKHQWDVVVLLERLGNAKSQTGDWHGARAAFQEVVDLARRLTAGDPANVGGRRDLALGLSLLCEAMGHGGEPNAALAACEESIDISRSLAAADPSSVDFRRQLIRHLERTGDMKLNAGDHDGLSYFEEGLELSRDLAEADPGNGEFQQRLSWSLVRIADARLGLGDAAGALAAYEEGLAIARKLAEADPGNAEAQRSLPLSLFKIGDVKLQAGDRAGALAAYDESLTMTRKLAEADPASAQGQTDLVVSLTKIAAVTDNPAPAYREALGILEALDAEGRLSPEQQGWIVWVNDQIAALPASGETKATAEE
jgi:tetratricopeptide (TPR) repeat protein